LLGLAEPSLMHGGRTMGEYSEAFVAFDVSKMKHAVAIADGGRGGEVRFLGDISSSPGTVERLIRKLAGRYGKLHFCYEAGPTGYGLYRQIRALGHACLVIAPALIPKRPGERVKTNRRDAVTLARLHRAGELTGVWVPDAVHEAVRDLVRAREAAADDLRRKRQQLLSFLLRHGRIYSAGGHWTLAHRRWLAKQAFEHAAQQIVFQETIDTIADAAQHLRRLEQQLALIVPSWSTAPVVEAYQAMRGASFLVAVIFGVDLNRLSVELARLSIWVHTFVPGLPLTVLDHTLVHGNALVGVGTIEEIKRRFEAEGTALFAVDADNLLGPAKQPLARLARADARILT
jgi:transposase